MVVAYTIKWLTIVPGKLSLSFFYMNFRNNQINGESQVLLRTTNFVTIIEIVLHYSFFEDIHTKQDVNNPLYFSHSTLFFSSLLTKSNVVEDNMAQKTISYFFPGAYYFTISDKIRANIQSISICETLSFCVIYNTQKPTWQTQRNIIHSAIKNWNMTARY